MDNKILFGLLNLGEGILALNYLIFCSLASLGVIQFVAGRRDLGGLMILPAKVSQFGGIALIAFAYLWFFTSQPDLFIPGLAGGELSTLSILGFGIGLLISIFFGILSIRVFRQPVSNRPNSLESVSFGANGHGELWLPATGTPPLVFALRGSGTDALDVLAGELVRRGAAVLLFDRMQSGRALQYAHDSSARFHPTRWYAVGSGIGADQLLSEDFHRESRVRARLALAPFGSRENFRPGLRWLRETDLISACRLTMGRTMFPAVEKTTAVIAYGEDDALVPPSAAREMFPNAIFVAGANHTNLAATSPMVNLAAEMFELHPAPEAEIKISPTRRSMLGSEAKD